MKCSDRRQGYRCTGCPIEGGACWLYWKFLDSLEKIMGLGANTITEEEVEIDNFYWSKDHESLS